MYCSVVWYNFTNVSEGLAVVIFRVHDSSAYLGIPDSGNKILKILKNAAKGRVSIRDRISLNTNILPSLF
jgi:hypothetical protein